MDMPTNCPNCRDVVELDDMIAVGYELHCKECHEEMKAENKKHEPNNTALWVTFTGLSGVMIYTIYEFIQSITVSTQIIG